MEKVRLSRLERKVRAVNDHDCPSMQRSVQLCNHSHPDADQDAEQESKRKQVVGKSKREA